MKNSFIKVLVVLATLISGSDVINASDNAFTSQAQKLEMQIPDVSVGPDCYVDINTIDGTDGSTIIVIRTRLVLNGKVIKDEMEIIITRQR